MPFNDTAKNLAFSAGIANTSSGIKFIGLGVTGDPGTATTLTGTEATGGSPAYARVAVAWAAPGSGADANSGALTIDAPVVAGGYSDLLFFNAGTGNGVGNYLGYAPINGSVKGFATCDAADVTANTITSSAHGLVNTDRVRVYNVFAESLPAGLTEGLLYFAVGVATDTFQVSLTSGGAAVDITGIGEMFFQKVIPEVFASQGQVTVAIGALVLDGTTI